jgi:hypothetical protein
MRNFKNKHRQLSALFQILAAVHCIHVLYGMHHRNINISNILLLSTIGHKNTKEIYNDYGEEDEYEIKKNTEKQEIEASENEKPSLYWEYIVDGIKYYVPNLGFVAMLSNFEKSVCNSPEMSSNDYGIRNSKVVTDKRIKRFKNFKLNKFAFDPITKKVIFRKKNNEEIINEDEINKADEADEEVIVSHFVPFITRKYPQIDETRTITSVTPYHLIGRENLTLNKFMKDFDSEPSIRVDLKDFQKFPTFGMYQDIQDVLRIFLGGKQTEQVGLHDYITGLHPEVKTELEKYKENLSVRSMWPIYKVELFLANKLIHKIFTHFKYNIFPEGGKILETYILP